MKKRLFFIALIIIALFATIAQADQMVKASLMEESIPVIREGGSLAVLWYFVHSIKGLGLEMLNKGIPIYIIEKPENPHSLS